jgi:AraC family transcriptional regulator
MSSTLQLDVDAYHPGRRQVPHAHDALHLSVVLSGAVEERVGNETVRAGPLDVVVKDSGVIHANDWGAGGARLARLSLPKGMLTDLTDGRPETPSWRWTHDPRVARPFLQLVSRHHYGLRSVSHDDGDLVDLVAAFTARRAGEPLGQPPAWLREAMTFLRDSDSSGLTGRAVAAQSHVHPVYLARCMRRWYGTGLGDAIRARRLRDAVATLADTNTRVSTIAYALHFSDEAHLSRRVHAETGFPPARLRRLLTQEV